MAGIKRQAGGPPKRGPGGAKGKAPGKGGPAKGSVEKKGAARFGRGRSAGRDGDGAPPRASKAAFLDRQEAREGKARARAARAERDNEAGKPTRPDAAQSGRGAERGTEAGAQWPRFRAEPSAMPAKPRPRTAAPRPPTTNPDAPIQRVVPTPKSTPVQTLAVTADEGGMRLDRFLDAHVPGLPFSVQQRIVRKGEVRVNGARAKPSDRLETGQTVRIPPIRFDVPPKDRDGVPDSRDLAELKAMILYEDDDMLVLNKPMGLAVQGGIGMTRHIDGMLESMPTADGQRPRLVHRIDKDTAGCLLVAKTRFAASELTKTFRTRSARKVYWALIAGVPKVRQGRISTYLAKDEEAEAAGEAKMRVARHGEEGAAHAVTYYAMVEHSGKICSWVSLKPVTGRTHQLRAHMNHIGNPIIGDAKYFIRENWEMPPGMQNRLHLLARRIVVPHPRTGKPVDVTAPLPPHMQQSWNLLSLDAERYDPIDDAPE